MKSIKKNFDLTIKTSDDKDFVKDIEVKKTTTTKSSQLAIVSDIRKFRIGGQQCMPIG